MIKLLKKYGVELKLKKCDLFRLIEGQKDTFLEDGFAFKMTNEEEMFKYEVILNGIYNKTKIEGEYKKFVYETQDAIQYLNYEEKQKMFNSIISETLKNLKLMKVDQQIILIPYLEPFINERYLKVSWAKSNDASGYEIYTDNNITKKITDSNITTANIYIGKKSSTVLYIRAYNIVKAKKLYSKASKRYVFLDN